MTNRIFIFYVLLALISLNLTSLSQAAPGELMARVSAVPNGDTIIVTDDKNKKHKVYLLGIEAPEMKQTFGKPSREYLQRLLFARNNQVKIIIKKHTRAKNIIGTVYATDLNSSQYTDINGMMVMAGFAWANPRTSKQYNAVEKIARNRKAGLWKQRRPIAPWQWRKGKR